MIGPKAEAHWRNMSRSATKGLAPMHFTLDGEEFMWDLPAHVDSEKLKRGEAPLATAWAAFAWQSVLRELDERYGLQHKIVVQVEGASIQTTPCGDSEHVMEQPTLAPEGLAGPPAAASLGPIEQYFRKVVRGSRKRECRGTMSQLCERLHVKPTIPAELAE